MKIKLPLRVKISVMLLVMYILNIAAIIIYIRFSFSVDVNAEFVNAQRGVAVKLGKYVDFLSESEDGDIVSACRKINFDEKEVIEIKDIEDNVVFYYPHKDYMSKIQNNSDFYIKDSDKVFFNSLENGRQLYFITIYSYAVTDVSYYMLLTLILFETVIIAVLLVLFSFYLKMSILNPLYELGHRIRSFKRNNKINVEKYSSEIEQLSYEFDNLLTVLDEEQKKQNRIIASMSHDIKTPLTSILGYTQLLKNDSLTEDRRAKYINTIYSKATTIKDLIASLDEYLSYNETDKLGKTEMSVDMLISRVSAYFESDLKQDDVLINFNVFCKDAILEVDELSIIRLFGNLISNSIKHKRDDRKLVLELSCTQTKDSVVFSFRDNGEGVEKEKINNIFEPFYTTDESRSKAVSGLGLSICKEIIDEHGGEIWATESEYGGLSVNFTIKKVK